jgi:hypothetical protein
MYTVCQSILTLVPQSCDVGRLVCVCGVAARAPVVHDTGRLMIHGCSLMVTTAVICKQTPGFWKSSGNVIHKHNGGLVSLCREPVLVLVLVVTAVSLWGRALNRDTRDKTRVDISQSILCQSGQVETNDAGMSIQNT